MLERFDKPLFGLFKAGQSALALAQQVLQLGFLGIGRLILRGLSDDLQKIRQVALGVAEASEFEGELGGPALERRVLRVMAESLLVDQEDLVAMPAIGVSLIDDAGVPFPGGRVVTPDIQVLTEGLLGLVQIARGLGAASAVEQGRGIPCGPGSREGGACPRQRRPTPRAESPGKPG